MFNLPTELSLNILSYLSLSSLSQLHLVCKSWNEFCNLHENTIYRNAASLHAYIPYPTTMLKDLGSLYSRRALEAVKTWKHLTQRRLQIQRNWRGKGPSIVVEHKSTSPHLTHMVHRIKVDELAGYIMTTSNQGGLLVTHIDEDRILWTLPPWYVHQYAHLEYGQGYMIFDRDNGDKEVWRRLSDFPDHMVDPSSAPDAIQHEVYDEVRESHSSIEGHFKPWAVLHIPELTSAFRFVYPTLIVTASDRAYLWDIPSGKLIQTLHGIQDVPSNSIYTESLGRIKYVDVSERHALLIGQFNLRVFSRATGKSVLDLSSFAVRYGFWSYVPAAPSYGRTYNSALERHKMETTRKPYGSENGLLYDKFVAVHVSSCGRHFAALLSGCRLLVVFDFEKVTNEEELYAQTLDIQIASHRMHKSIYLAFDYGRISVVTTTGVFIIEVDESTLVNISNEAPTLFLCRVCRLTSDVWLEAVSCLMMSDTGLYLNWNPTTFIANEDEEMLDPWSDEDDYEALPSGNTVVMLQQQHTDDPPESSKSSVFSIDFACYSS